MKIIPQLIISVLFTFSSNCRSGEALVCDPPQKDNEVRVRRLDHPDCYVIFILAPPNTISMQYSLDGKLLKTVIVETVVMHSESKISRKSVLIDLENHKVSGLMTSGSENLKHMQNWYTASGRALAHIITDQDPESGSYLEETYLDADNNKITRQIFYELYDNPIRWISLLGNHKQP